MKPKIIAVVGPTASGKTSLAIKLAKELDTEIISADSRLVYKGFNIAAAKPTLEERENIPHHLIDIVEPEFDYSVGCYVDDATKVINQILAKGKTPIIVGGTGLYFRVLLENYNLPKVETNYELRNKLEQFTKEELLNDLQGKDLITYERLKESNKRRIVRALEVMTILNCKLSDLELEKDSPYDVEWCMPEISSREELYERINKRVDVMLELGIVEETKALLDKHGRIKNIVDTIGYREIIWYLDGKMSLEEAIEKLKQHTRNYAKRQLTWFRKNPKLNIQY